MSKSNYSIIWKYKVKSEKNELFRYEYGQEGSWSKLFNESGEYQGSFLYKSTSEPNTYLLVDRWISQQAYESFIESKRDAYDFLSYKFKNLYESEEKIGSYDLVLPLGLD